MTVTAKVWADGEAEPSGLFDPALCPYAPFCWFEVEPKHAAELYALERHLTDPRPRRTVHVLDSDGRRHTFAFEVGRDLVAREVRA